MHKHAACLAQMVHKWLAGLDSDSRADVITGASSVPIVLAGHRSGMAIFGGGPEMDDRLGWWLLSGQLLGARVCWLWLG
jgi:hypothetical protein